MERQNLITDVSQKNIDSIVLIADRLDFTDVQILRKFYLVEKEQPMDSQPYCFPILFREMKKNGQIKIGVEGFRKRLNNLERVGLLKKIKHSNPTIYLPVDDNKEVVHAIIKRFFFVNGLEKFL
jgi:hypothetical protein